VKVTVECKNKYDISQLRACPDCGAKPGQAHNDGCDVERCSHCGQQRLQCKSKKHDPKFSRWTVIWPGEAECYAIGMVTTDGGPDLNKLHSRGLYKLFMVKP
jgi:hypothetical protein